MSEQPGMARLTFGRLTEAWRGEASHFTPLLAQQLDALGTAIGVDLASIGEVEVSTAGGRRIDIVAQVEDGSEFVVENQYGRGDHDHLTRGLAYAIARHARGLVVVAEEHRDEFRAVAQYLNDLAEADDSRGISVWLVEARAVRIEQSPWAPLFTAVIEPNSFTATVEKAKQYEAIGSVDEFLSRFARDDLREAAKEVKDGWAKAGFRRRLGPNHVVLEAPGPSVGGVRTVIALFEDGKVFVPFSSYAGTNSGIPIPILSSVELRSAADNLFGFHGAEKHARTERGWLTPDRAESVLSFAMSVADAYARALAEQPRTNA